MDICDVLNHLCHFMIDIVGFKSNSYQKELDNIYVCMHDLLTHD